MPSGAAITARGRSEQDLPLRFSSLQEQHDFRSWWASSHAEGGPGKPSLSGGEKKRGELISGTSGKECGPAVVPLTPAVFNPVSYSFPRRHQQPPLDNFHRNDSSPEITLPHNQTRRDATMKWKESFVTCEQFYGITSCLTVASRGRATINLYTIIAVKNRHFLYYVPVGKMEAGRTTWRLVCWIKYLQWDS